MAHPQRSCCGCAAKRPQHELLRLASHRGQRAVLCNGREKGRGAYLCFNLECARKSWKKRAIERTLKLQVPLAAAFKAQVEAACESGAKTQTQFSGENPHMN